MKDISFLCGLPRSGSTLLASILSQNPAIYASPNSALVELLVNVRNHLRVTEQVRAFMQPGQEKDILLSIIEGTYRFTDARYVIDKSRAWPHPENIRLLCDILPEEPKFIATVRDLPAVLTSFIALIKAHPESESFVDRALREKGLPLTTENRCQELFSPGGNIWESWFSLKMAFDAGYARLFHVVEYDDLTERPRETVEGVYDFLGIPYFGHDLTNIVNRTPEDDAVYNLPGMHDVRAVLKRTSQPPAAVLGPELVARYAAVPHFWRASAKPATAGGNPFKLTV
ncbi:MAG TPA: sulfotransferase [Candidatus Paceibacterota bacterium]|nr:sulfotransferase [Candidatus Paceibacterota bacterium]